MKKALLIISIIIFISLNSFSQVEPVEKEREGAGFASFLLSGTSIDKQAGILIGGGGGFILKDVRMGAFFEGLVNNISFHILTNHNTYKFQMSYGGLWVGYPIWKSHNFHALVDLKLYFGKAATQSSETYDEIVKTNIYGVIPFIGAEYYIGDFVAISLGIDYRLCFFVKKIDEFKPKTLNMPNIRLGVKIGIFR